MCVRKILALGSIVLLVPIFVIISLMVLIDVGSPILFRQRRLGKNGEEFTLVKFRTMVDGPNDEFSFEDARVTHFGVFLRRAGLDELPSLASVVTGQMAFIGPRPLLPEYRDLFTRRQWRRHRVLPGLTGLAQVLGRNDLSWRRRFAMDLYYVKHKSIKLDAWILSQTIVLVLKQLAGRATGAHFSERYK